MPKSVSKHAPRTQGAHLWLLKNFLKYLEHESMDKKKQSLSITLPGKWTQGIGSIPRQYNGCDCGAPHKKRTRQQYHLHSASCTRRTGVFMTQGMDARSRGTNYNFNQSDMPNIRMRMVLEIHHSLLFDRSSSHVDVLEMDDEVVEVEEAQLRLDQLHAAQLQAEELGLTDDLKEVPFSWWWRVLQGKELGWQLELDDLITRLATDMPQHYVCDVDGDGACYFRAELLTLIEMGRQSKPNSKEEWERTVLKARSDTVKFMKEHRNRDIGNGLTLNSSMALAMLPDDARDEGDFQEDLLAERQAYTMNAPTTPRKSKLTTQHQIKTDTTAVAGTF